jgi:hypothetical protein
MTSSSAPAPPSTPCPRCGQQAPIVYRGVVPTCTACGALRAPLTGPSVNLAGQPAKVGGTFARVAGWLVLLFGGSIALSVALLFLALHLAAVGLAIAAPIALVALVVGVMLVTGGRSLRTSGVETQRATREQALLAMAAHRGAVSAAEAARMLGIAPVEADAILTALAKREPERVAVDVDDHGVIWYRVSSPSAPGDSTPHVRVDAGVRVGAPVPPPEPEVEAVDEAHPPVATRAPR